MNKYKRNPELILDLHGYTTNETQVILDDLLSEREYKYIRIIVGRGLNSENGPVLPDFVKQYLAVRNIRFNSAKPSDGGSGALEVYF